MMKITQFGFVLGLAGVFLAQTTAVQAQDVGAGKIVFKKCAQCHKIEPGRKFIGPSLYGVVGRTAGTAEGYRFSRAMKAFGASGNIWTEALLDEYLQFPQGPRKLVPKTRMAFPGLKSADDRANVIAYLKSVAE